MDNNQKENESKCNKQDEFLKEIFLTYKPEKDNLIQILNSVQENYGYIPEHAQKEISKYLKNAPHP